VQAAERLALAFLRDHPEDAARLLERATPADTAGVLASVPADEAAEVFRSLGPTAAHECAAVLESENLVSLIEALPMDVAAGVLRRIDAGRRDALLAALDEDLRERLVGALTLPDNSAGALADPLVLALPHDITVGEAQKALRIARPTTPDAYVVSRDRVLVGVLAIQDLMAARPKESLRSVMLPDPIRLEASADLATVAVHPAWREFDALPVVDAAGRLIGGLQHRAVRRLNPDRSGPMFATLVGLSELYWAGLTGIIASLAPANGPAEGGNNVP
jgi:magnesium transporter